MTCCDPDSGERDPNRAPGRSGSALRAPRPGAPKRIRGPFTAVLTLVALLPLSTGHASGQVPPDSVPPVPDSLAADSLGARADSAALAPDSTQVPDTLQVPDSLGAGADTIPPDSLPTDTIPPPEVDLDTIPLPIMPGAPRGEARGWGNEVWEWDREALRATRALELTELLSQIPGVIPLRGGDYGMPRSVSSFAGGAGRIRVFWDGFELEPLEGGVVDLTRVDVSGLERVRAERTGDELRVEVWSLEQADRRPYTLIETGTGDLDTNLFRGTFGHPRVFGGKLHVALDRLATNGTARQEPGSAVGWWLSYSLEPNRRWGLRAEMKRVISERDTVFAPSKATRSDWVVRGRVEPWIGVMAEGFAGRSWIGKSEDDSLVAFTEAERTQYGLRVGLNRPDYWGLASVRFQDGDGVPGRVLELRGGWRHESFGGVEASWLRESWTTESAATVHLRAWTRPVFGLSAFASYGDGSRGVPFVVPPPEEPPEPPEGEEPPPPPEPVDPASLERFSERTTSRLGAQFEWRGVFLSAARLSVEADSLYPLGLPPDAGGLVLPGGKRKGWEVSAVLPLWPGGLALKGTAQRWDDAEEWRYLPLQSWTAALDFQRTFLASRNLEILATLGVQGRDPMLVPLLSDESTEEDPMVARVPWAQTLYARLQIRVLTVRLFVVADNLTRLDTLQDYPGRLLPNQRIVTGVRWTLWN